MAATEVFETSLTNSSPSGVSIHQDDHFQWRNIWFSYSFSEELFKAIDQLKNKQQILRISGKIICYLLGHSVSSIWNALEHLGLPAREEWDLQDFKIPWPCMWWNPLKFANLRMFFFFSFNLIFFSNLRMLANSVFVSLNHSYWSFLWFVLTFVQL